MPPPRLSTLYLATALLLLPLLGVLPPPSQAQPLPLGAPLPMDARKVQQTYLRDALDLNLGYGGFILEYVNRTN